MTNRKAGILLHISSLPGRDAIGTLGKEAFQFVNYLKKAGQSLWQILPINPTGESDSPFNSESVFAGNPYFVDLENLVKKGDLEEKCYQDYLQKWKECSLINPIDCVNYKFLKKFKPDILMQAYKGFNYNKDRQRNSKLEKFLEKNEFWINDYAKKFDESLIDFYKYEQFAFDEQMTALHDTAKDNNIEFIGDLAFYPANGSVDVSSNKELFQLDKNGKLILVAAVPPDYFSKNGQLWGNPLYKWGEIGTKEEHEKIYRWWGERIKRMIQYHYILRLDHFRGFVDYGCVSSNEKDAKNAKWIKGPGKEFFDYLKNSLGELPLIAEDLGIITDDVRDLLKELSFPGMRILQFADFNDKNNYHLPHNATENSVFYTGTHDNETLMQKIHEMGNKERDIFLKYLSQSSEKQVNWQAIDLLSSSRANRVIIPMQDILALGPEARMNHPGEKYGNWKFRLSYKQFSELEDTASHLKELSEKYNRKF